MKLYGWWSFLKNQSPVFLRDLRPTSQCLVHGWRCWSGNPVPKFPEKWLQTANHPSRYNLSQHVKWKPKILGFSGCCFRKENTSNNMGSLWGVRVGLVFSRFFFVLRAEAAEKDPSTSKSSETWFFQPKILDPKAAYAAACSHVVTPSAWKYLGVPGPWSIHFSIHLNDSALD